MFSTTSKPIQLFVHHINSNEPEVTSSETQKAPIFLKKYDPWLLATLKGGKTSVQLRLRSISKETGRFLGGTYARSPMLPRAFCNRSICPSSPSTYVLRTYLRSLIPRRLMHWRESRTLIPKKVLGKVVLKVMVLQMWPKEDSSFRDESSDDEEFFH